MARRQSGVLDLFGGLALGLSQSMQANKDAGLKQEFLKAQMDEAKAKAKHYEAQVKADLMKQEMQGNLMRFMQGGMQPGGPPAQGLAPGAPPPMPPQEIPAPQQGAPAAPMAPMSGGEGGGGGANIGGINFSGYATDPNWGAGVNSVMSRLPALGSPDAVEQAISQLAPNSPLAGKGNLIFQLAQQGGYDPRIPLAIAMQESSMGTAGRAVRTQNPWNIGNDDSGRANYMPSIDAGIQAFHDYTLKRTGGGGGGDVTQQIAQAQTNNQMQAQQAVGQTLAQVPTNKSGNLDIKSMSLQKRTMLDVLFKQAFDLDTNFRKEQTDVREVQGYLYILKDGEVQKVIPGPGKVELRETPSGVTAIRIPPAGQVPPGGQVVAPLPYLPGTIEGKDQENRPRTTFYDKNRPYTAGSAGAGLGPTPPSQPANTITTGPSPREVPTNIPQGLETKIIDYTNHIDNLMELKNKFAPGGKDVKNVFGLTNQLKAKGADNMLISAGMEKLKQYIPGAAVTPDLIEFHKSLKRFENIKVHDMGGSNLTYQELTRSLQEVPRANTPEQFAVAVDTVSKLYNRYIDSVYEMYGTPEKQREQQRKKPSLDDLSHDPNDPIGYFKGRK